MYHKIFYPEKDLPPDISTVTEKHDKLYNTSSQRFKRRRLLTQSASDSLSNVFPWMIHVKVSRFSINSLNSDEEKCKETLISSALT